MREIEVTESMLKAGAAVLQQYGYLDSAYPTSADFLLVRKVYLAMIEARNHETRGNHG